MISHALTIIVNELNRHLLAYGPVATPMVELGNIAEGFKSSASGSGVSREVLNMQLVNIREEKSLKNLPNFTRDEINQRALYENPPVFLNFQILIVASHTSYTGATLMLSRAIRFFQLNNTFTETSVDPASISTNAPVNPLDRLGQFKLIFDLYSPAMEEVNHMWGTLGGKQYPFVLYLMRMLDLKFQALPIETKLIVETQSNVHPISPIPF
ncbi:hypothetical protein CSQ96_25550 [Janthinobacterium sp. BJB412]|nr:hypothetical protein CSQ96_25550 [Janthinobacterium sp. BJB412]